MSIIIISVHIINGIINIIIIDISISISDIISIILI